MSMHEVDGHRAESESCCHSEEIEIGQSSQSTSGLSNSQDLRITVMDTRTANLESTSLGHDSKSDLLEPPNLRKSF